MPEEKNSRKINLLQVCYTSEWALAKFFRALVDNVTSSCYNLVGVTGRELDKDLARERMINEDDKRNSIIRQGKNWRIENTLAEKDSIRDILRNISKGVTQYFHSEDGDISNITQEYDAAAIFSSNKNHIDYIRKFITLRKHVLCEKPIVTVTDENHKADRKQLNELEKIVNETEENNRKLVLMDSEHYSYKPASITFFERVGDMVAKYGKISNISGCTKELDDPERERVRKLLCKNSRTGLLLDMGVHLFGIVSNIGGTVGEITDAKYGIYPGHKEPGKRECLPYDVETYAKVNFNLKGNLFHEGAKGEFEFVKFIDRLKNREPEKKQVEVTFTDKDESGKNIETIVTVDFASGKVIDNRGVEWYSHSSPSKNEYVNILNEFHKAVTQGTEPRTSFRRSIKNLDAIYRIYEQFPVQGSNLTEVYQR